MKILIFTPVWKRKEVFEVCLSGIERLIKYAPKHFEIEALFMISEIWAAELLTEHEHKFIFTENEYLGDKKNTGLTYALEHIKFDYLLEIGSDDLITNEYLNIVEPLLKRKVLQISANSVYFINIMNGQRAYFKTNSLVGLGRFIHREAIEEVLKSTTLWNPKGIRGMDTYSAKQLLKKDIDFTQVQLSEPYLLDIKSSVGINTLEYFQFSSMSQKELLSYFPEKLKVIELILNAEPTKNNYFQETIKETNSKGIQNLQDLCK